MSAQFTTPVNLHGTNGTKEESSQATYSVKAGLAQMLKVSLSLPNTYTQAEEIPAKLLFVTIRVV